MSRESVRRAIRTFLQSFLALMVPGFLGWLHALTEWARAEGQVPFPDGRSLAYLGVSAIVAGVIAVVNLLWNVVEDATGRGFLRNVPPRPATGEGGYGVVHLLVRILVVVILVIVIFWLVGALL
jgi:hypothetical protein